MGKEERLEAKIEAQLREWAAELESLKTKADKAVAEARKEYSEHVDELREGIEAKLGTLRKTLGTWQAKAESAEAAAKTRAKSLHGAIQAQVRELRPLIADLRGRAEQAAGSQASREGVARQAGACPGGGRGINGWCGESLG